MANNQNTGFSLSRFFKSFSYALSGILKIFRSEPNMLVHLLAAITAVGMGFCLHITKGEWLAVIFSIGFVFTAEAINSAIEKLVDLVSPERNHLAGWVKDVAAGAVLIAAITAAVVGAVVFMPYLF